MRSFLPSPLLSERRYGSVWCDVEKHHPSSTCAERCGSGSRLELQSAIKKLFRPTGTVTLKWHIKFNIVCTIQPAYFLLVLKHYVPSRTLRSSGSNLLLVPHVRTGFGSSSFSVAAPIIWNSLPLDIRNSSTISCFRRQLKTLFHKAAFGLLSAPSHSPPSQRLRFGWQIADIVRFTNSSTYLLTYYATQHHAVSVPAKPLISCINCTLH